jgi:23S rRNA pseudouridine1911/1915/1917 synthase
VEVERNPTGAVRRWRVEQAGERLDQHVAAAVGGLSRSQAQRLIQSGEVLVNGQLAKPAATLRLGDEIEVRVPAAEDTTIRPEALALRVVYESADVVVVDKPAGVIVHPAGSVRSGTLVNAMLYHYPEVAEVGPVGRQGVIHRLDKDTSGLLVLARTVHGLQAVQEQFRKREVWKTYLALLAGHLRPDSGAIDAPVGRHPYERQRMAVVNQGGRPARTEYEVIEAYRDFCYVQAHPLTGRTHQLRVHFAAVGHPVAGDPVYGHGSADLGLRRQFLHAHALRFLDPDGRTQVAVESPLPGDLAEVLQALRLAERGVS